MWETILLLLKLLMCAILLGVSILGASWGIVQLFYLFKELMGDENKKGDKDA